jgi:hypothetical protein
MSCITITAANDLPTLTAFSDEDETSLSPSPHGLAGHTANLQDLGFDFSESRSSYTHISETEHSGCLNPNGCCFALASKALKSLYIISTECMSTTDTVSLVSESTTSTLRTANSVLVNNKLVILALSSIVHCSCSSKIQLQLVMATICEKLITWCDALIRSPQNDSVSPTMNRELREARGTLSQRVVIADHYLEGTSAAQSTARAVLSQLQDVDFLVVALSRRIQDVRGRAEKQVSNEGRVLGVVGDGLLAHLLGRLSGVREEALGLMGGKVVD